MAADQAVSLKARPRPVDGQRPSDAPRGHDRGKLGIASAKTPYLRSIVHTAGFDFGKVARRIPPMSTGHRRAAFRLCFIFGFAMGSRKNYHRAVIENSLASPVSSGKMSQPATPYHGSGIPVEYFYSR